MNFFFNSIFDIWILLHFIFLYDIFYIHYINQLRKKVKKKVVVFIFKTIIIYTVYAKD